MEARAAPFRAVFFFDAVRLGFLARRPGVVGCGEGVGAVVEAGVLALRGRRRRDAVVPFSETGSSTGAGSAGEGPAGAGSAGAAACSTETVEFSREVGGVGSRSMS